MAMIFNDASASANRSESENAAQPEVYNESAENISPVPEKPRQHSARKISDVVPEQVLKELEIVREDYAPDSEEDEEESAEQQEELGVRLASVDTENVSVDTNVRENRVQSHNDDSRTASPSDLARLRNMFGGVENGVETAAGTRRSSDSRRTASPSMLASLMSEIDGGVDSEPENIFEDENQAPTNSNRRTFSPSDLARMRSMFGGIENKGPQQWLIPAVGR